MAAQKILGESLGAFEARRRTRRPETTQAGSFKAIDDAGHERCLGSHDREIDALLARQALERRDIFGRDVDVTVAAGGGNNMAGVTAGQTIANWWVTAVNPSANSLSVVNPNGGEIRTYTLASPTGREELSRVKPGDKLTAINSDIAVVSITPK